MSSINLIVLSMIYYRFKNDHLFTFGFFLSITYFFYGLYTPYVEITLGNFHLDTHLKSFILYNLSNLILIFILPKNAKMVVISIKGLNLLCIFIFLILCLFYKLFYLYSEGVLFEVLFLDFEGRLANINQSWVISGYILNILFVLLMVNYVNLKSFSYFVILLFLFYVFINFSIGNRRDYIPIIFCIVCYFANNRYLNLNFSKFLFVIFSLNFTALLSFFRDLDNEDFINPFLSNEFVYPYYTLLQNVNGSMNVEISNIFLFLNSLIPRFIWDEKPYSLAMQYVQNNNLQMGYAYLPLAEFYYIYNVFWFIPFTFLLYFFRKAVIDKFFSIPLFLIIIEFSRSESQSILYQLMIYVFLTFILGLKYAKK